jgi:hypothetical protein
MMVDHNHIYSNMKVLNLLNLQHMLELLSNELNFVD